MTIESIRLGLISSARFAYLRPRSAYRSFCSSVTGGS